MKNRVSVAFLTEKPPQSQFTIAVPMYGTALRRFVITVAPQKDIWPQGKTYPINAIAISTNKIINPLVQV